MKVMNRFFTVVYEITDYDEFRHKIKTMACDMAEETPRIGAKIVAMSHCNEIARAERLQGHLDEFASTNE